MLVFIKLTERHLMKVFALLLLAALVIAALVLTVAITLLGLVLSIIVCLGNFIRNRVRLINEEIYNEQRKS